MLRELFLNACNDVIKEKVTNGPFIISLGISIVTVLLSFCNMWHHDCSPILICHVNTWSKIIIEIVVNICLLMFVSISKLQYHLMCLDDVTG